MVLSSEKNLYEILEISISANSVVIKSAYRKLARKYHPDLNGGDEFCIKKFKEITQAYEILSDEEKKKNYDILRGYNQETSYTKFSEAEKAYKEEKSKRGENVQNDIFASVLNDILSGFKKTTTSQKKSFDRGQKFKTKQLQPERGSDVTADIVISIIEAIDGTERTINILHTQACENCEGRPFINGIKCPICNGVGESSIHKKLNVKIPRGVKNGSKIRIANEGNKGYNGGRNGDLYLNIKIENDSKFKYDGLNVLSIVSITPFEAVLGDSIEVKTPKGYVTMKVTPNTQSGQKFRLQGQGLEQDGKKGDMIVTVSIEVPKNPSKEEIELYKKLKNISKTNIRKNK